MIILDNIERIIEFTAIGMRFSNTIYQLLLGLLNNPTPEGRKILIIGTSSSNKYLNDLELLQVKENKIIEI